MGSASLALGAATLALAHVGPTVRVSRVLVRSRVELRVGFVFACVAQRCASWCELATPVTCHHEREHSPVRTGVALVMIDDRWEPSAIAGSAFVRWLNDAVDTDWRRKETAVPTRWLDAVLNTAIPQNIDRPLAYTRGCRHTRACLMD